MQNHSPQYIKDATIFLEHKVFSRIVVIATHRHGSFNNAFYIFLNNCENNERITSLNEKILNFLNVCGPYVIMRSVNFGTV